MKNRPGLMLIVGIAVLLIGTYLYFQNEGVDVSHKNSEIATTEMSAEEASKRIAANNQSEVGNNDVAEFMLSFGGVLTVFSVISLVTKKS